jgi:hypothetical protein
MERLNQKGSLHSSVQLVTLQHGISSFISSVLKVKVLVVRFLALERLLDGSKLIVILEYVPFKVEKEADY